MKLGWDLRGTTRNKRGIGHYNFYLLQDVLKHHPQFKIIGFVDDNFEHKPEFMDLGIKIVKSLHINPYLPTLQKNEYWEQKVLPQLLQQYNCKAYYSCNMIQPIAYKGIKITQIHDLSFDIEPSWYEKDNIEFLNKYVKRSALTSNWIFADSINTINDLKNLWGFQGNNIECLYPILKIPVSKFKKNLRQEFNVAYPYVLYVGTLHPRKNLTTLLKAFNSLQTNLHLIVCGASNYGDAEYMQMIQANSKIHYLGYVSDELLAYIFKKAYCFVLPSYYEGFGLPVLEAQSYGVPCIISNNSSLAEVAGNNSLTFETSNTAELSEKIKLLENNHAIYEEYQAKSLANYEKFRSLEISKQFINRIETLMCSKHQPITVNPKVDIVTDTSWITGSLANFIQKNNNNKLDVSVYDYKLYQKTNYDLLHLMVWTMKKNWMNDYILTVHHLDEVWSGYDLSKAYHAISPSKFIIVLCSETRDFLINRFEIDPKNIYTIPNGIELEKFKRKNVPIIDFNLPKNKYIIGNFSSCHQRKGLFPLIEAMIMANNQGCKWHLVLLMGRIDGNSSSIQQNIRNITSAMPELFTLIDLDQVSGANFQNWNSLYRAIDCYCSPSYLEGCAVPVLEAMASKVPVVSTLTGMTKDYFNKKNLIPIIAGDAESIFKGLKDSIKYRKSLIREGSKTVQFYNAKRYGLDHLKVYNQALNYYKKPIAINIPYKSKQPVIILYGEIDQEILQRYGNIMLEELHKVSSHIYYIYDLSPNKLLEKYNIFQIHKNLSIYEFARKSNAEIFITLKLSKLYYSSDMLLKYLKRFKINQYDCAEVENLPATQQCNFYSKTSLEFIDTQFYKIENLYKELSTVQKFNYGKFSIHVDFMNFASTAFNFLENNNLVNLFYEQERKNYNLMIQNALNIVNLNAITIYNNTPKDSYCFKRDVSDCNVLFINQVSEMGGAENSLYLLVKYLKRYKPIVWLPCDGTLAKMIKKLGHKVIIMPQNIFNFQQPQMLYSKQKELLDIINTHKISVIHSNSYKVANLSGMISTISGIPSITHQRDVILQPGHAINSGLHLNSKVVAVSEYIASNIKEKSLLGDDRISQIYNGVEIPSTINRSNNSYRELYHIPDDAIVIGYVGMTYTWKGTHIFVEVAKQITEKYKNVYAIIFGEPKINQSYWNYYNELKIKVSQSAVKDRIIFAGYREDKPNIYQCINILVHPSIEPDPMPRSVIEGMAYKCCVIGSDIGGIPEEIGEKNLLVTPNNIRELYKKLQYLITHQEITEEYGNKLYQRCFQKFTIDEHVSKVVNLYDEVRRKG